MKEKDSGLIALLNSIGRAAKRGRGQIVPGPQASRGLLTPNASRSGDPHKVNQHYLSKVNFYQKVTLER